MEASDGKCVSFEYDANIASQAYRTNGRLIDGKELAIATAGGCAFVGLGYGIAKVITPKDVVSNTGNNCAYEGESSNVIYGSDDIANYQYNLVENPGPLAELPNQPAKNYYGGRYNMEVLQEDIV